MRHVFQRSRRRAARTTRAQVGRLEPRCLPSGTTPFHIVNVDPGDGAVVPALPNGQVVITLSEPVAGLSDGQSPIQATGGFNPYDVMLIPRGPSGIFSAPSGIDGGSLPVHANVVYHVNGDGTSEFVLTPTAPLSTDVFLIHVDLSAFRDASGNTLTDPNNGDTTFLLQRAQSDPAQAWGVVSVTADGKTPINNNIVAPFVTIQILFNRPLYPGAAEDGNVQLIANPGPDDSVVPSVAAYNPTTDSIYLTPTTMLHPGVVYAVRVAGKDSGSTYVSDDQGYGGPGYPLAQTFYDTFEVSPIAIPQVLPSPFTVTKVSPTGPTTATFGYVAISLNLGELPDPSSLTRWSVMVIPQSGGLDNSAFDAGDVPLNGTVVVGAGPFGNVIVVVPSQPMGDDQYLVDVGSMTSGGSPLVNNAGQPAGVGGNPPYYATFGPDATTFGQTGAGSPSTDAAPAVMLATIPDASVTQPAWRPRTGFRN
ncbi:MAG: hypothetical protein P4L84_19995 [Isosphaeraceae bacterium]|nr:hypothetical protein [Isosphaeraceae bacterium]